MSWPLSSSLGTPDRLRAMLPEVVAAVSEEAFFGWADTCEGDELAELLSTQAGTAPDSYWLHATVRFTGAVTGSLELLMPAELSRELGVAMLGWPAANVLTDALLADMAGEVANMICGALLTRAYSGDGFELVPPLVARAAPMRPGDPRLGGSMVFRLNDRPAVIRFAAWER